MGESARAGPVGPLPPGIFGHIDGEQGVNPYVYQWKGELKRRPISDAIKLLAKAGYPSGRDEKTGKPLTMPLYSLFREVFAGGYEVVVDWMVSFVIFYCG